MACVTRGIYSPGRSSPVAGRGGAHWLRVCLKTQDIAILCNSTPPVAVLFHSVEHFQLADRFQSPSPAQDGWGGVMGGNVHSTGEHCSDQVLGETGRDPHLANQRQRERHPDFGADECQDQCYSKSKLLKVRCTSHHILS